MSLQDLFFSYNCLMEVENEHNLQKLKQHRESIKEQLSESKNNRGNNKYVAKLKKNLQEINEILNEEKAKEAPTNKQINNFIENIGKSKILPK